MDHCWSASIYVSFTTAGTLNGKKKCKAKLSKGFCLVSSWSKESWTKLENNSIERIAPFYCTVVEFLNKRVFFKWPSSNSKAPTKTAISKFSTYFCSKSVSSHTNNKIWLLTVYTQTVPQMFEIPPDTSIFPNWPEATSRTAWSRCSWRELNCRARNSFYMNRARFWQFFLTFCVVFFGPQAWSVFGIMDNEDDEHDNEFYLCACGVHVQVTFGSENRNYNCVLNVWTTSFLENFLFCNYYNSLAQTFLDGRFLISQHCLSRFNGQHLPWSCESRRLLHSWVVNWFWSCSICIGWQSHKIQKHVPTFFRCPCELFFGILKLLIFQLILNFFLSVIAVLLFIKIYEKNEQRRQVYGSNDELKKTKRQYDYSGPLLLSYIIILLVHTYALKVGFGIGNF